MSEPEPSLAESLESLSINLAKFQTAMFRVIAILTFITGFLLGLLIGGVVL